MLPQDSSTAIAVAAAAVRCCIIGCTRSAPRIVTDSHRAAFSSLALVLDDSTRACKRHVRVADRFLASPAVTAATAAIKQCCYCSESIINQRPCRPVIDGVKQAAHMVCNTREKRRVAAAVAAAAVVAADAAEQAKQQQIIDTRHKSLRSSGTFAIITRVSAALDRGVAVSNSILSLFLLSVLLSMAV